MPKVQPGWTEAAGAAEQCRPNGGTRPHHIARVRVVQESRCFAKNQQTLPDSPGRPLECRTNGGQGCILSTTAGGSRMRAPEEGMRIGQRSDSKSDAPKGVEGSNPLPSALFGMIFGRLWQPTVQGRGSREMVR